MTNETGAIDYEGLRAHIIETIMAAFDAFKAEIASRAAKQEFVTQEVYARIAAQVFKESLN